MGRIAAAAVVMGGLLALAAAPTRAECDRAYWSHDGVGVIAWWIELDGDPNLIPITAVEVDAGIWRSSRIPIDWGAGIALKHEIRVLAENDAGLSAAINMQTLSWLECFDPVADGAIGVPDLGLMRQAWGMCVYGPKLASGACPPEP